MGEFSHAGPSDPTHVELLDAAAHCRHLVLDGSVHAFFADHRKDLFPMRCSNAVVAVRKAPSLLAGSKAALPR
jgi:hypothetical protein